MAPAADTPPAGKVESPGAFRTTKLETYPLLRLSTTQYQNIVADVLGVTAVKFPDLIDAAPADGTVSAKDLFDGFHKTATAIATLALGPGGKHERLCGAAAPDAACAKKLVESFGPLLFRRSLTPADVTEYSAVFTAALDLGATEALKHTLVALLLSPSFFYVVETPAGGDRITDEQIAARLALLLWDSAPDAELLMAATSGKLRDKAGLGAQLARMTVSPKFSRFTGRFFESWLEPAAVLEVQKNAELSKVFTSSMAASMAKETHMFLDAVWKGPKSDFGELFTSTTSFVNSDTAKIYGITDAKLTKDPVSTEIPASNPRAGVLTQPSVLTRLGLPGRGSAVMRGIFVLERLLCSPPPPPPPDVTELPEGASAGKTQRERLAMHRSAPVCAACHESIDGIGLGLEAYDALGRHAAMENGVALDGAGTLVTSSGEKKTFRGAPELGRLLATSPEARNCFVDQWFERNLHRKPTVADARDLIPIADRFVATGSMREILEAYVGSNAFVTRRFK